MKKLIIANWKMNPRTVEEAKGMFRKIRNAAKGLRKIDAVVCPPFVFVGDLANLANTPRCSVGAQDAFWKDAGPYTGEVSPLQLKGAGARCVIIGHSERRALGETDEEANRKTAACLKAGLRAVLCVGEEERDAGGRYFGFLEREIKGSLRRISSREAAGLVIAYEPIWAIGKDAVRPCTPQELFEMTIFIRKTLSGFFPKKFALSVPILYGGSVDDENAEAFLTEGGAQGLLVGGASLDAKKFVNILKIANKTKSR